jgi:hypothetical protein
VAAAEQYDHGALRHVHLAKRGLARIVVAEKGLQNRVQILEAKTRTPGSPYYQINPTGRVP